MKKFFVPLMITCIGGVVIFLLFVARPQPTPKPPPEESSKIRVNVVPAQPQSRRLSVFAQGTVIPKRRIDLTAEVSGRVLAVDDDFVEGGFFEAEQVLVGLDERDYRAALLRAEARVAEAGQHLAEERGRNLQAEREWRDLGNETANNLFLRKPQLAAAEANLASAQGEVSVARRNLERTQVSVPFDGRIISTHVNPGQYVSAGSPLASVYDATVVEVRVALTDAQAALIDLPLTPTLGPDHAAPVPVTLSANVAGTEQQWPGRLVRTQAQVDPDSRMYYAVVEVSDPFALRDEAGEARAPLLPGLFVQAEITGKSLESVMHLPRSALFGRNKLLVLDAEETVEERTVRVLRRAGDHIWVQGDLHEGTLISLEKHALTPVGTQVEPVQGDGRTDDSDESETEESDVHGQAGE